MYWDPLHNPFNVVQKLLGVPTNNTPAMDGVQFCETDSLQGIPLILKIGRVHCRIYRSQLELINGYLHARLDFLFVYLFSLFLLFINYVFSLFLSSVYFIFTISVICLPKRDEVTGEWRMLHNEELRDLYSSPSIIRIIKSRRMRWADYVARMGRRRKLIDYWWESQRESDH
jgi:hypothetical protein